MFIFNHIYLLFLFPEIVVFLTQGTTGKPKGVTLSHGALIIQSLAKIAIVGYNEDDVCHSVLHKAINIKILDLAPLKWAKIK